MKEAKIHKGVQPVLNGPQQKAPFFQPFVQPKLTVNEPGDVYEQEADVVADRVMRMADVDSVSTSFFSPASVPVQRKCAHCEEEEKQSLQRKESNSEATAVNESLTNYVSSLSGRGQPLSTETKTFFAQRMGHDFSAVRVHTNSEAMESAQAINSLAYTTGNNIVFNQNQYSPHTQSGKHLLAHELTHVVQQSNGVAPSRLQRLVRTSLVTCPPGQNPFGADRRAASLLNNAVNNIDAARAARPSIPASPEVEQMNRAMRTAFGLNPASDANWNDPAPRFGLLLIRRRLAAARDYINSVVFTINCVGAGAVQPIAGCGNVTCNGPAAWSCPSNPTDIVLCPPFWALDNNGRAIIFMHEIFHITFLGINDWVNAAGVANPGSANAHCYAQFVALANGFNSPPGFQCN